MFYDVEVIVNTDSNFKSTTERKTIICKTEEEIKNMEDELKGINNVTHEFETTDGMVVSGLEILECYRKYS